MHVARTRRGSAVNGEGPQCWFGSEADSISIRASSWCAYVMQRQLRRRVLRTVKSLNRCLSIMTVDVFCPKFELSCVAVF